jgi:MFS family permease
LPEETQSSTTAKTSEVLIYSVLNSIGEGLPLLKNVSPWRILLPVALGTCLSLVGDSSLYAVLPTHTQAAGVPVITVGVLLSANRFIRLFLNGPMGIAYDRFSHRALFISALFIGALSTAIYGLTRGFWPLFLGRLLWGLAWSGIWVGGNTIVLDISNHESRGRYMGIYQFSFFLGAASGAILGGSLTDRLGFHQAFTIGAVLTLLGAIVALIFLPETHQLKREPPQTGTNSRDNHHTMSKTDKVDFASAAAVYGANRLLIPGILTPTLGIFLLQQAGEQIQIAGRSFGVATLTGLALGLLTLIAMGATLIAGWISDHIRDRWRSAAGGLLPGILGFVCLSLGLPSTIILGIPLVAMTSGSNQALSTVLIGDFGDRRRQSRQLGLLFTVGDLMSAIGPPLAYAFINLIEVSTLYLLSAGIFAIVFLIILGRIAR